jgi:hypothetical protein
VRLDRLLDDLGRSSPGQDQDAILQDVARLVFPHAFAEEAVLWPALRRASPEGHELTLRVEQEHQEVNELWTTLEAGGLSGPERAGLLTRLTEVLREDVRDEEDDLLPVLQQALDTRRLRRLGVAWEAVRRVAPTRPHPVVARRPPGNALAALPLTVLDRCRDRLDARARRAPRGGTRLRKASRTLAGAAGRVERLGVLRRGEDPSTHRG